METRWLYTASTDFEALREASKGVCVIPMGCVEKHGLHLPLGTDIIQASHIAFRASQIEPFTVFPDFWFGDYPINTPWAPTGSLTPRLETELLLLEELCDQIGQNGFRIICVYNWHGGNTSWLKAFLRKMANRKHGYVVCFTNGVDRIPHKMAEYLETYGSGSIPELKPEDEALLARLHAAGIKTGHACISEAANVLAAAPESVHLECLGIEDGRSRHQTDYLREAGIHITAEGWDVDYPNNFAGDDPSDLNERLAQASFRMESEDLAKRIKILKEDQNLYKWHEKYWI
ncbi:MAG: creatininase family protein [Lachnospiraceae bacterium]|nr:creatininase family protein [Lachnospiraceae bacterium]